MKKTLVLLVAIIPLIFCSCLSCKSPSYYIEEISVTGVLQTNNNNSYFIIIGGESKNAKSYFLVKDNKNKTAWETLISSAGKTVSVNGNITNDGGPWFKILAVKSVAVYEN